MTASGPARGKARLRRAIQIFRDEGLRSLWFKFLGETVYRRMDLIERDITPVPASAGPAGHLQVSLLSPAEVDEFMDFRDYADRNTVLQRLARGERCFLVRDQGAIVHCCWTVTARTTIDYLACKVRLASGVVYVYEAYTAQGYRGRSVSSMRSAAMLDYFSARGYRRLLAVVWPENLPVYRSLEKAGYSVVGRIGYLGRGRYRRYFQRYAGNEPPLQLLNASGARPPGYGEGYWNHVTGNLEAQRHYLDPFLAELKRRENLRLVRDWGGLRPDGRLLKTDVFEEAMGADAFLGDLQDEVGLLTGMDVSTAVVRRAAGRFSGDRLRFLAADVRRLPFADARFSTVVSTSTLDHFPEPADLGVSLRELFRVLEPGGRLVITLDNRQNLFDPLLRLAHWLGMVPYFMGRSYTVGELRSELGAAGFRVLDTTAILHNPRLVAVGTMRLVRWLRWRPLLEATQELMLAAQGLEGTRLCYFTGSFVAAAAVRPAEEVQTSAARGERS